MLSVPSTRSDLRVFRYCAFNLLRTLRHGRRQGRHRRDRRAVRGPSVSTGRCERKGNSRGIKRPLNNDPGNRTDATRQVQRRLERRRPQSNTPDRTRHRRRRVNTRRDRETDRQARCEETIDRQDHAGRCYGPSLDRSRTSKSHRRRQFAPGAVGGRRTGGHYDSISRQDSNNSNGQILFTRTCNTPRQIQVMRGSISTDRLVRGRRTSDHPGR